MTDDFAIVGSSNVSTNGLTVEGAAAKGWIEANVADADPAFVSAVQALFNELWDDPDTRRVGKSDVERAKKVRKLWPKALAPQGSKTLFEACRENPASFSNVYVAAYDEGLEPEGGRLLKEIKAGALPPKSGLDASNFKNAWGYQFENIPDGAWLLDLSCKGKKPRFVGCAQATGLRLKAGDETDLTIALPGSVRLPGASKPFRISAAEKASLIKHAQRILKRGNLVPLSKVIHLIDKA